MLSERNRNWTFALLSLWAGLWAANALDVRKRAAAPGSDWLHVESVHVYDTWEGEQPYMHVKRTIRQPFRGEWIATIRRAAGGGLAMACLAEGTASYATDARLPADMKLDWWTYPTKCALSPGRYVLETEWKITAEGYPLKLVRARSNTFEVHPHYSRVTP